jgi:glycine/D-amino acid oxidase-like deaminating enzyme
MKMPERRSEHPETALVIGGGIVGLTTGYALARAGIRVTILDAGPVNRRASTATAGIIGGSSVIPWAEAGLWRRLPRMILNRQDPLFLSWPLPKGLLNFVRQSRRASRPEAVQASAAGLANLGLKGLGAWYDLLSELPHAASLFRQNGCLLFHRTPKDREADASNTALRRSFGMDLTDLTAEDMRHRLPALQSPTAGGVCVNAAGHVTDPLRLQQHLKQAVSDLGGTLIETPAIKLEIAGDRVASVRSAAARHEADIVILTAGAGALTLTPELGLQIPMAPAWGVSVTFENSDVDLDLPLLVLGDGYAATPSAQGLRVSGLLQVGGAGKSETMQARLVELAKGLFGPFSYTGIQCFTGPRPLMADSLPALGPDPTCRNVYHNFGHGHWGLTQAAISAQVIANLVTGQATGLDIAAYSPARFLNSR